MCNGGEKAKKARASLVKLVIEKVGHLFKKDSSW